MNIDVVLLIVVWSLGCIALGYVIGSSISFDVMWRRRIQEAANRIERRHVNPTLDPAAMQKAFDDYRKSAK